MTHCNFVLFILWICIQKITSTSHITTCNDIWNGFTHSQKVNAIRIKTYIYTLSNGVTIRCGFIDLGNDMLFVGAMSEYGSRDSHQNDLMCPMHQSCPFNEYDLETAETAKLYRWSLDRMISYRNHSIHSSFDEQSYLLFTCNMDLTVTRDYMLMPFNEDFVTKSFAEGCYQIKQANIRGYECENNVGNFWNRDDLNKYHFHLDSGLCKCGGCCSWQTGSVNFEDNFGYYINTNPSFSCTASSTSTTEYWIGSILKIDLDTVQPTIQPTDQPTTLPTSSPTTALHSIQSIDGNVSCTNLHENAGIQHDEQITECVEWCSDRDDCEMFNYFVDFKQNNDSRCYIFDTLCDISID
eukprot:397379_1